ncbi:MAG: caspase family protein [Methylobacterium radiotolerans]
MAGKYALVIGNSAYPGDAALVRPVRDAAAFANALRQLGFAVTVSLDLDHAAMQSSVDQFVGVLAATGADVSLLYFSGHGVQVHERNYIVPIDFVGVGAAGPSPGRLIEVQPIIDRMSEHSGIRLILLDACRNDPGVSEAAQAAGARGMGDVDILRVIRVGDRQERVSGLADMVSDQNTFIAFAAGPGGAAYEGNRTLSPFTEALVRHLDAIDLPLANLMIRIRTTVRRRTDGKQRPWDHSSLAAPFFFNPGSLLLFLGNLMALFGLLLSFVPYSLVLASGRWSWGALALSMALPAVALCILLTGMQSAYTRLKGQFEDTEETSFTVRDHFRLCLQKGVAGGFLGALIGSFPISVPYYDAWLREVAACDCYDAPGSLGQTMAEVAVATALVAGLLGTLSLFWTRVRWSNGRLALLSSRTRPQTLVGAACGGVAAGLVAGPLLVMYFGRLSRPPVTPDRLLPGAIIGSSILIFSIVNFDFERLSRRRIVTSFRAAFAAPAVGGLATLAVFGPLYVSGIVELVTDALVARVDVIRAVFAGSGPEDVAVVLGGSMAYGLPTGLVLGVVIGVAIILTERWSTKKAI